MSVAARGQDVLIGGDLAKMLRGPPVLWSGDDILYCIVLTKYRKTPATMAFVWYFLLYFQNGERHPLLYASVMVFCIVLRKRWETPAHQPRQLFPLKGFRA